MTTALPIRTPRTAVSNGDLGGAFAGSFALHGAVAALLLCWAYIVHSGQSWGDAGATAGAIQASMVPSIPLPPKQPADDKNMLATENPSPAPIPPAPKTVTVPEPDAVPVPAKTPTKPPKIAQQTTPTPPLHPQITQPEVNKAPTGEAPGIKIAMTTVPSAVGTHSIGVTDAGFNSRFTYYVQQIDRKVASQWYTGMLDPQASGHRVYITFQIERDGTPTHIQIAQRSGDFTLDQTALSAVQHVDTFPPLPEAYQGSFINVTYYFDPPPPHQ